MSCELFLIDYTTITYLDLLNLDLISISAGIEYNIFYGPKIQPVLKM